MSYFSKVKQTYFLYRSKGCFRNRRIKLFSIMIVILTHYFPCRRQYSLSVYDLDVSNYFCEMIIIITLPYFACLRPVFTLCVQNVRSSRIMYTFAKQLQLVGMLANKTSIISRINHVISLSVLSVGGMYHYTVMLMHPLISIISSFYAFVHFRIA